jgi:oleandomycin transport system ATP-binding protein
VRPTDPARSGDVATILTELTGVPAERRGRDTYAVSVPDDVVLPAAAARIAATGIAVTDFSLHLPSLDEVFFTLTGRSTSDDESPTDGS